LQALELNTLTPDQASLPVRMRVISEAAFSPPSKIAFFIFSPQHSTRALLAPGRNLVTDLDRYSDLVYTDTGRLGFLCETEVAVILRR
jgi:hypothetical protein